MKNDISARWKRRSGVVALSAALPLGLFTVGASPALAAPTNDNFVNAKAISGVEGSASGSLVGATLESGEPQHYNYWADTDPVASIWHTWVAPVSGLVEFSSDDGWHTVDLYTGSAVGSLEEIGYLCDSSERGWSDHCRKAYVTAGATYRISVAGDATGATLLSWRTFTKPANDNFSNAAVVSGLDASFGIEEGADLSTAEAGEPQHWFGTPASHSVWYRWTATWNSEVTIDADAGEWIDWCPSAETNLAVYTGSSLTGLTQVTADQRTPEESEICESATVSFTARAGTTYRIAVDSPTWEGYRHSLQGNLHAAPICRSGATTGNDTLVGTAGNDVLCGLEGDDLIKGQGGDDLLIGGPGIDAASYADATTGVTANLTTGSSTGHGTDTLRDIENLVGSPLVDKLDGNGGTNVLNGGGGDDGLWGQGSNDSLLGGDGNDTMGGGLGNDRLNGGAGRDVAHYGQAPAVTVNLGTGSSTGEGTDALSLLESITGSPGADKLTGNTAVNVLLGGGGNDTLVGQGGNDQLAGGADNDSLTGGTGTDSCDGGTGTDTAATCETRVGFP